MTQSNPKNTLSHQAQYSKRNICSQNQSPAEGAFLFAPIRPAGGIPSAGLIAFGAHGDPHGDGVRPLAAPGWRRATARRRALAALPGMASRGSPGCIGPGARSEGSREGYLLWTLEGFWRSSIYCSPLLAIVCKAFSEPFIDSGNISLSVPPSVMKGLLLSSSTTASRYFSGKMLGSAFFRLVPLGKCFRSRLLAFSLAPRCYGECGSQKQTPATSTIPEPWSHVSELRMNFGELRHLSDYDFLHFVRLLVVGLVRQGDVRLDLSASVLMVFLLAVPIMESSFQWPGMTRSSISGCLILLDLVAVSLPTL